MSSSNQVSMRIIRNFKQSISWLIMTQNSSNKIICLNTDTFDPKICVKWMFLTIPLLLKAINKKTAYFLLLRLKYIFF